MRRIRIILAAVTATVMLTGSLMAQPDSAPPPDFPKGGPHHRWQQMAENIENLRLLKLLETVDLTEEQSTKFVPLFQRYRKDFKELLDQRRELVDHLADLVDSNASDADLNTAIRNLLDLKKKMEQQQADFINECRGILTPKQLARLVIFQERFEREILQSLREFRQGHQQGGGRQRP
jgi:Spy/CpxP family protein refolding chaperone